MSMAVSGPPMVIPDLHVRRVRPDELELLLDRRRLLVGLRAMHDYVSREPGKVEQCAKYDFPAYFQAGVPMTTPALIDDHLLACDERAQQWRMRQHGGEPSAT
jgi:hypothetical protein